jgi:hypothetical protein
MCAKLFGASRQYLIEARNHTGPCRIAVSTTEEYLCGETWIPAFIAMVLLAAQCRSIQRAVTSLLSKLAAIPVTERDISAAKGSIFVVVKIVINVYCWRAPMETWSRCAIPRMFPPLCHTWIKSCPLVRILRGSSWRALVRIPRGLCCCGRCGIVNLVVHIGGQGVTRMRCWHPTVCTSRQLG